MSDLRPELLPCPFCGGAAEFDGSSCWSVVRCRDCAAAVSRRFGDDAVEAWNRRPGGGTRDKGRSLVTAYWKGREVGHGEGYADGWSDGFDEGFASADDWLMRSEDALREHGWVREEERHGDE